MIPSTTWDMVMGQMYTAMWELVPLECLCAKDALAVTTFPIALSTRGLQGKQESSVTG